MTIEGYINKDYPVLNAFCSVEEAKQLLLEKSYVVIFNDEECPASYSGILTMSDVIRSSHRLIIDCLTPKISISDSTLLTEAYRLMNEHMLFVLPVVNESGFLGVIEKKTISSVIGRQTNRLEIKSKISEKAKNEFLHNLSHEIRTPLNSILGFMDLIADLDGKNWKTIDSQFVKHIERSADNFLIIMNDLVELSLVHSGEHLVTRYGSVNLKRLFQGIVKNFTNRLDRTSRLLNLRVILKDENIVINSDQKKLKHILFHLIDKLSLVAEKSATIEFGLESLAKDKCVLIIKGEDITFPPESKERILKIIKEPVQQNFNRDEIRIVIVAYLVESLQGRIEWAEEEGNTIFRLHFPLLVRENSIP